MKKSMDAETILYVGKDFSIGYHKSLLKHNYYTNPNTKEECEIIDRRIENATNIYYKVNDDHNSWIKYEYAIRAYEGDIEERLEKALRNPDMVLSKNLIEIPKTEYHDAENRIHIIHPNDGKELMKYWNERIDGVLGTPKYTASRRKVNYIVDDLNELPVYAIDLTVKFDHPINNAIITLNNFFLEYEQISDTEVLFMDVESFMTRDYQFDDENQYIINDLTDDYYRDEDGLPIIFNKKQYNFEANALLWNNVKKVKKIKPISIEKNVLTFNEDVGKHGFLTYNGLLYSYKLKNPNVERDTQIVLSYDEFDYRLIDYTLPFGFQLTEMALSSETDSNLEIKKYEIKGVNNIIPNEVEFTKRVKNAAVICNHLDFTYHLQDAYTVRYPMGSTNGPAESLLSDTPVKAIFLYTGTKGYDSAGESDVNVEENLFDTVLKREDNLYLNDYHDVLSFDESREIFLYTAYKPMKNTLRIFINGVKYDEGIHFNYDRNSKAIIWTFSSEFGGFDLKTEYNYVAVYDLLFNDNNITNIDKFVSDYKIILKKIKLGLL